MNGVDRDDGGLPILAAALRQVFPDLGIEPGEVLARVDAAGVDGPNISTAAKLSLGDQTRWVPWPVVEGLDYSGEAKAAMFRWGGRLKVFPIIRLGIRKKPNCAPLEWEYFSLDEWLRAAFCEWRFPLEKSVSHGEEITGEWPRTILDRVKAKYAGGRDLAADEALRLIGNVIRFATDGRTRYRSGRQLSISGLIGLGIPVRESWLRPLGGDDDDEGTVRKRAGRERDFDHQCLAKRSPPLWATAARSLVLTGGIFRPAPGTDNGGPFDKGDGVPRPCKKGRKHSFRAGGDIAPLDPYHTPDGDGIRLRLHLPVGSIISCDRQITFACENAFPLSAATSQIPFAGYDDPRRLQLGAKAQTQAVELTAIPQMASSTTVGEQPLVTSGFAGGEVACAPGVNLRVGYVAWAGWNHEDAWVVSKSAAARLSCARRWTQDIDISPLEAEEVLCVRVGETVERGKRLVTRSFSPGLLWPDLKNLKKIDPSNISQPGWARASCDMPPQKGDKAKNDGRVEAIEIWDFFRGRYGPVGSPAEWRPLPSDGLAEVQTRFRKRIRVRFAAERELQVGDKLANRHGHKGIVGLILPDERMPIWDEKPLEALIDPISVINRGNWGQLYESLAGAIALKTDSTPVVDSLHSRPEWLAEFRRWYNEADEGGRSPLRVPAESSWFRESHAPRQFRAVVGCQFVMRLPEHASEKLSSTAHGAAHAERDGSKLDTRARMAMWAHGYVGGSKHFALSRGAKRLRAMLWLAGLYMNLDLSSDKPQIVLRRLDLSQLPTGNGIKEASLQKGKKGGSVEEQLDDLDSGILYWLPVPTRTDGAEQQEKINWLPVLSLRDIADAAPGGFRSALIADFVSACHAALRAPKNGNNPSVPLTRAHPDKNSSKKTDAERSRLTEIRKPMKRALHIALGTSIKAKAMFDEDVFGCRRHRSGSAVISPSGLPAEAAVETVAGLFAEPLGLNEISLPEAIQRAVSGSVNHPPALVWLKRDPVLHRWGMLPVNHRTHQDAPTIRLPASLLGALGADFDGDVAVVLAVEQQEAEIAARSQPSRISMHDILQKPMFRPSKQYVYGLHLLSNDVRCVDLREAFHSELKEAGAPPWLDRAAGKPANASSLLDGWCITASGGSPKSAWWGILERYALLALSFDPGMRLAIPSRMEDVAGWAVTKCEAAKSEFYNNPRGRQRELTEAILNGNSLCLFVHGLDPISEILAAAGAQKGLFGNLVRRLVVRNPQAIDARTVMEVQTLTEKLTQAVLSIKSAGKPVPRFSEYKKSRLALGGSASTDEPGWIADFCKDMRPDALAEIGQATQAGASGRDAVPAWREWLFAPYKLLRLLDDLNGEPIRIPINDIRAEMFLTPTNEVAGESTPKMKLDLADLP